MVLVQQLLLMAYRLPVKQELPKQAKSTQNSWFIGMGPSEDCKVVVAIVLEEGSGQVAGGAASRAQNVLETALRIQGVLNVGKKRLKLLLKGDIVVNMDNMLTGEIRYA